MIAEEIIAIYYPAGSVAARILLAHGQAVARKALAVAASIHPRPDMDLIREGALLHDIGIFLTDVPELGCYGRQPYIRHGLLGRRLLEKHAWQRHALICERHVGAGLSRSEILDGRYPLPQRDMLPVSVAEQIICYADKFFSKSNNRCDQQIPLTAVRKKIHGYGPVQITRFEELHARFGE